MEKVNLFLYKGQTYQRNFVISNFTMPITQIYLTVKKKADDKNVVFQKKIGSGITLMDYTDGIYTYLFEIESNDTEYLKTDYKYGYDITLKSDDFKMPIAIGELVINPVYTRKCDET